MITQPGRTAAGRRDGTPDPGALWTLVEGSTVTTAVGPTGPIAGAELFDDGNDLRVTFWLSSGSVPRRLPTELVDSVLRSLAVQPGRTVQAAFPCGEYEVLAALRELLGHVRVRLAGSTCLLEGILP